MAGGRGAARVAAGRRAAYLWDRRVLLFA